jgi:hypothetical protein
MIEHADFKSTRGSNLLLGLGLLIIPVSTFYIALFGNEDEFLGTRVRRGGGVMKLIEQTIGWELFAALLVAFGLWAAVYSVVSLWKAFDSTPDVRAYPDRVEFHPAVRRAPARYDEISHWSVEFVNGHPVLWIHFIEPYWSLQGLFRRRTVKLEGDKQQLEPLADYFARHWDMGEKFVPS